MSATRFEGVSSFVFRFFAAPGCISSLPRFEVSLVPSALVFTAGLKSGSKARCIRKIGLGKLVSFPSGELLETEENKKKGKEIRVSLMCENKYSKKWNIDKNVHCGHVLLRQFSVCGHLLF